MTIATAQVRRDAWVIGLTGAGHLLSHVYIFVLPPLFPLLKDHFGVSYVELGLAVTVFNVLSGLTQAPCGFLVDRFGARPILAAGLALSGLAFMGVAATDSYWALVALMGVAGVANSVYHPADYAILSASIEQARIGRAFSLHTFAGFAGGAIAPGLMLAMTALAGGKSGLALVGAAGVAVAAAVFAAGGTLDGDRTAKASGAGAGGVGWRLLLSRPLLMCFLFYVALAMSSGGLNSFSVAALMELNGLSLAEANVALTGFLGGGALGILAGGVIADRTSRHELAAAASVVSTAALVALIGAVPLGAFAVIALFTAAGLLWGIVMPSRDMLVRAVTPPGQTGAVFGFVSTGFNVGGVVTPLVFGWVLDNADPAWVFYLATGAMGLALLTVLGARSAR
jgi:sugar phosphate permease